MEIRANGLYDRLFEGASDGERRVLEALVNEAATRAVATYLVGGSVRDLLLERESLDRDVTVVGDAVALAGGVARRLAAPPPVVHEAFGTATVRAGSLNLDLITARREAYPQPGSLPVVEPAGLAEDLARRDFTINAMALGLTGGDTGALVDPHGGLADLRGGTIRILHERSFRDDATRLLRACRYAARFGFMLDPEMAAAACRDRGYLATISPTRVRHELDRTFLERRPDRSLALMQRLRLPGALMPELRFSGRVLHAYRRMTEADRREPLLAWLLPIVWWAPEPIERYVERFALTRGEARAARAMPELRRALTVLVHRSARRSEVVGALERFPEAAIRGFILAAPQTKRGRLAQEYLEQLRAVRPALSSADLKAMGVKEGPRFGEILRRLRAARLDDPALSLDAERRLVQDMLNERAGG
jgi:tRNA nucleotidyltransferase (CCA-adding enzyme)